MESTVSTATFLSISKALNSFPKPLVLGLHRHFTRTLNQSLQKRLLSGRIRCISNGDFQRSNDLTSIISLRSLHVSFPLSSRFACISSFSTASFASGGGSDGHIGGNRGSGGGGNGDDGSNISETNSKSIAEEPDKVSALSPDVIILDVGGMSCGGCAASVKRILENQPQVSSASVNFATETAIIWPVKEVKVAQNWQQQLGETLAKHLTDCGFKSNLRGQGAIVGEIPS
ncbi:hypothetical protein NE237_028428 [Protea cynaroides]|uniref:HMA domain-containing protein n=1 Tax=Protea cynaroides TaxID=273540 RepID=A0A9Q0GR57_9MAGN|nr:hypothetical protein NE237_028428 [Protea cynaroides]